MEKLTFIYRNEPFTNSFVLAKGTGNDHRSVNKLTQKYMSELQAFGKVRFQIAPSEESSTGQKSKVYYYNEQQSTFLISLMRNTPQVVAFKQELVRQFYEMRAFISALVTAKEEFAVLTENIRLIHDNPKPHHYSTEADMLNRLVLGMSAKQFREEHGLDKKANIRQHFTQEQLALLNKLQSFDVELIKTIYDYKQRKELLQDYWDKLLSKKLECA